MTEISEQDILEMDMKTGFELFNVFKIKGINLEKEYEKIRFGINLSFDIYDLINENYTEDNINNKIIIHAINGTKRTKHETTDFYTEIEQRKALLTITLLKNIEKIEEWDIRV